MRAFRGTMVYRRALSWAITIILFACSFKFSNMTAVYVVSFLMPIFVILIRRFLFKRRIGIALTIITIVMFVGIVYYKIVAMKDLSEFFSAGSILSFVTALGYAIYMIMTDLVKTEVPDRASAPLVQSGLNMTLSIFLLGSIMLILASSVDIVIEGWIGGIGKHIDFFLLAGTASALGMVALTEAFNYDKDYMIAPYDYTIVIWALIVDTFYFNIEVTPHQVYSALFILFLAFVFCYVGSKKRTLPVRSSMGGGSFGPQ